MTTSSHNQFQPFARRCSSPLLRDTVGRPCPSLRGLPTTLHKLQMATHSRGVGRSSFGSCAFPPAAWQGRACSCALAGSARNGVSRRVTLPRNTGRGLRTPALLADGRGCCPCVATAFKSLRDRAFQCLAKASPTHRVTPSSGAQPTYGHRRPNHWVSRTK